MSKIRNIIIVTCFIGLAGICLLFCLVFDIGQTASRLNEFLAQSPSKTLTITGFNNVGDLYSIDNLFFFQALKADGSIECLCIYAADKTTGKIIWSTEALAKPLIEEFKQSFPDSSRYPGTVDIIEASSKDRRLYLLINDIFFVLKSSDGSVIWKSDVDYHQVQITEKEVFLVSKKQSMVAHDKASGRILWEHPARSDEIEHERISLGDTAVYERFEVINQNFMIALSRVNGEMKWEIPIREYNYEPLFFGDYLIFCQFDKWGETVYLTALDAESGNLIWEKEFLGIHDYPRIAIADGQVILRLDLITENQDHREYYLSSVDAKTGNLLWTFNQEQVYGEINYTIEGDHIFVVTSTKHLFSLNRFTGDVIWDRQIMAEPRYLLEEQSILLVMMENNRISAYDTTSGTEIWSSVPDLFLTYGFLTKETAKHYFRIDSGKLLVAGDKPWIKTFDILTGQQINIWKHNDRYHWLPQTKYEIGLDDGQSLFITGFDGRFSKVASGPHRIFIVSADTFLP